MENSKTSGFVHSIQSLGTVDGPGVRFVAFLSGCPLRCSCCHNPDTWDYKAGEVLSAEEIIKRALRYKEYFKDKGGITLTGGEPLCQPHFVKAVFTLSKEKGINTCLDTSGVFLSEEVKSALSYCDRVLLDIKYTNEDDYIKFVGTEYKKVLEFLDYLNEKNIKTTIRQVVIPTVNDDEENYQKLLKIVKSHKCVDKIELLPFRKLCKIKYENLKIPFPFNDIEEANPSVVKEKEEELNSLIK